MDRIFLCDAVEGLRRGQVSSTSLVSRSIEIANHNTALGMFISRFDDQAMAAARYADTYRENTGELLGPLHGVPIGIKDMISTVEAPTTAQSLVLDPEWSSGDAVVIRRLRDAGAVIIGKLTTMEFAAGAPDSSKPFPIPRNPWSFDHWAGGSSSGSGSAVSVGAVLGALGTDSGGSIRIPSAFCGTTGLKPTFGRVPKSGCVPFGYSLDKIGPMASSARDCALVLSVIAGQHSSDPSSACVSVDDYLGALTGDLQGVRIGVDRLARHVGDDADPALSELWDAALAVLATRGATLIDISLPMYDEMSIVDMIILRSEAFAYHREDLIARWNDYFAATRMTIGSGIFYGANDYVQAQRCRRVGQKELSKVFDRVDAIITPTSSIAATPLDQMNTFVENTAQGTLGPIHTAYWSAVGNPALSIPIGLNGQELPLAMQIAGRPFDEATILRIGDAYQASTKWHIETPPMTTRTT